MSTNKQPYAVAKARILAKIFDIQYAALYLKRNGWSVEGAVYILLGK